MTDTLFPMPACPILPVDGTDALYPVRRIFCVGRNYAAHAAEMGGEVDREAPWYFTKSAFHLCQSERTVPYPAGTANFHHEVELVVALGEAGHAVPVEAAARMVFGHACGLDMTRRDRQQDGKDHRRPWSLGKDVEDSAVIGPLRRGELPAGAQITLDVSGTRRQEAPLADMVWSVPEIISHLSQFYRLGPGDLIMTGTPAGVGPVEAGDSLVGKVTGLPPVTHTIAD